MKGRRRSEAYNDGQSEHGDPGPTWEDYGDPSGQYDGHADDGYDYNDGSQAARQILGCPFTPDPEGYVPPMDWSFHGGARASVPDDQAPPAMRNLALGDDYMAATLQSPTSDMPTEYPEPDGGEIPMDIGLKWHLPPEQRHKHDLTPAEAGWQSAWGLFVPYDMEPSMPETAPPLPSRGFSEIYSWVCSKVPPEIIRQHRNNPTKYVEGYLAKCMAMGRRPDIYRRYAEAPAVVAAPSESQKPTRADLAPF